MVAYTSQRGGGRDAAETGQDGDNAPHAGTGESVAQSGGGRQAARLLSLAAEEARRLGHDHVGTEHLLLAIIREGEGVAAKILKQLGALDEAARVQTLALLRQQNADGHTD